jgi:hypothetical protein
LGLFAIILGTLVAAICIACLMLDRPLLARNRWHVFDKHERNTIHAAMRLAARYPGMSSSEQAQITALADEVWATITAEAERKRRLARDFV